MPRDGSGVYHTPAGTDGVPDTTIESSKYNINVHDVETDLNTPRPIVAGGTGATSADSALVALSGEKAKQVITNFNTTTLSPGSFYAATTATNSPVTSHAFAGAIYYNDVDNFVVEARDITDPEHKTYYRIQSAGVWGAWTITYDAIAADARYDARYVNVTGDTMTGGLIIDAANAGIEIGSTSAAGVAYIDFHTTGTASDYDVRLMVASGTQNLTAYGNLVVTGQIDCVGSALCSSSVVRATAGNNAQVMFQNPSSVVTGYVYWDMNTNNMSLLNSLGVTGSLSIDTAGVCIASSGWKCRAGVGGAISNTFNLNYDGAGNTQLWIDTTNFGNIQVTSDYRIKKDVIDLPGMWDTVKALRPIKYTHTDFSPPSHLALQEQTREHNQTNEVQLELNEVPLVIADDVERWGFVAHELQETLTPSVATGYKDAPDIIQSPDPLPLIAALTKALQEAMSRIEALEAR